MMPMPLQVTRTVPIAAFTLLFAATLSFAQEPVSPQIDSQADVESLTGATTEDAVSQCASEAAIPLSPYTFNSTKSGNNVPYNGCLVGGDPFSPNPNPVTIDAVFIPLIILITQPDGSVVTFDPTAPDPCDGGFSAVSRFKGSPLVVPSPLFFNGVYVGVAQYTDGFMSAEFWNATGGSPFYSNPIKWSFHSAVAVFPPIPATTAIVQGTGTCSEPYRGVILQGEFSTFMKGLIIPALQSSGVISPKKFAFFLTKNVVTAKVIDHTTTPPTTSGIFGGQHYATGGSPKQTWARAAYTIGGDVKTASHEIAEWMNDPLLTNSTPSWGHIGEDQNNCGVKLEVGDPVNGISMPLINTSGYDYHVQELAFFSWFYNAKLEGSLGAGGMFSGNGKFTGPSKICKPTVATSGGTYH